MKGPDRKCKIVDRSRKKKKKKKNGGVRRGTSDSLEGVTRFGGRRT